MDIGLKHPYDLHPMGRVLARVRAVPLFEMLGTAAVKALPLAWTHAPVDAKRQILARVRDINPFASLPNNDNLRRAARLAWIAAALEIVKAAQDADQNPDWTPAERDEHQRFGKVARAALIALRDKAYDRKTPLADSPIDAHVTSLTLGVAEPIDSRTTEQAAHAHQSLTAAFRDTLRAVTGEDTVPDPVARVAVDGVPVAEDGGATVRRGFGELVFNEFARLLCDPAAFPEGREALRILTGQWSLSVAQQTRTLVEDHGARLGTTLDELSARVKQDLDGSLGLLVRIDETVGRVERKVDAQAAKLDRYIALAEADGAVARAADAGFTKAVVVALIERMDHLGIQADDLIPWVDSAIDRLRAWKPEITGDAAFDALCAEAARLFNEGRLDAPAALFRAERDRLRKARVEDERRLLLQEIHYNEAAINPTAVVENLRELAALDGVIGSDALGLWLHDRAIAYYNCGLQNGDNSALLLSIAVCRSAIDERPRERVPYEWVRTQNNLGVALTTIGERESGTARLNEAVSVYRVVLEECICKREPQLCAMTLNNLGAALKALGERDSGRALLEEAVFAFRAALEMYDRKHMPLDWAMAQNNLGNVLQALGEREDGTDRLEEAESAYRRSLKERTRELTPIDWAMTLNNLGNTLRIIGCRNESTEKLEEAVSAFRSVLEVWKQKRWPLHWAGTKNNLGIALQNLSIRKGGAERLKEAISAYRAALEEWTRERVPLDWAMTQNNLGNALSILGEEEGGVEHLEKAISAYHLALEERNRERVPLDWAMSFGNQGVALMALAERREDGALAERALRQITEAHALFSEVGHVHAAYCAPQMEMARALVARLRGGG